TDGTLSKSHSVTQTGHFVYPSSPGQVQIGGSRLSLFSGTLLVGSRALGVPVSKDDSHALMHLWKYVGWLIGVDEDWLFDPERAQHQLSYAILLAQDDVSAAGAELTSALVAAQADLHYRHAPAFSAWYTRIRLLSMLTGFIGIRGMRDLGQKPTLPWAFGIAWVRNTVNHRLIGSTRFGDRYLEFLGARARDRARFRHFGTTASAVGGLAASGRAQVGHASS
ncbi:oxygenase MpaB family protein, partial [Gordonia jinhuaensis]|uniref:oxygenase MpaB family protein n=1 Tax=Gordonia jinhuaensis TaxID=1517702 RepID=UPI0016673AD7